VIVDQVPLERFYLFTVQDDLGKLADPRVNAVHDLAGGELFFEHISAAFDALQRLARELDFLPVSGDSHDLFRRQAGSAEGYGHNRLL
jgi:hypothetical protein